MRNKFFLFGIIFLFGKGLPMNAQLMELENSGASPWDTSLQSMPIPRKCHASCQVDGKIYIIGGFFNSKDSTKNAYSSEINVYNPLLDAWDTSFIDTPIERAFLNAISIDGRIYIMGGTSYTINEEMYAHISTDVYIPESNTWQVRASFPGKTFGRACELNGYIYESGGYLSNGNPVSSAYCYDPKNDSWKRIADMNNPRGLHALVSLNNKIYAVGGHSGNINNYIPASNSLEMYDPEKNEWFEKASLPIPLCGIEESCVTNEMLYVFGGRKGIYTTPPGKTVFKYNPKTDTWTELVDMPKESALHTAELVDNKCFLFGGVGYISGDPTNKTWSFDLSEVSIGHKEVDGLRCYPNPVRDNLYIEAGNSDDYLLELTDIHGRRILQQGFSGNEFRLPVQKYKPGFYLVRLRSESLVRTAKIEIQ